MPPSQRKTAAIVVIGDEILKGTTKDTNSHFLCKRLHKLGVNIRKVSEASLVREDYTNTSQISVVGDDVSEISREVHTASTAYDYVITSGGVGPTHDDKTYLGLAQAFADQLHFSDEIRQAVNRFLPSYIEKKKAEGVGEGIEEVVRVVTEKLCTGSSTWLSRCRWAQNTSSRTISDSRLNFQGSLKVYCIKYNLKSQDSQKL
uniref:MoCF_biosynth domain-containing protein n=1 Tax=Caenorhabditis tropicalis TaxID=1561998 RepID=A0A1I7TGH0_9PELO